MIFPFLVNESLTACYLSVRFKFKALTDFLKQIPISEMHSNNTVNDHMQDKLRGYFPEEEIHTYNVNYTTKQ